MKRPASARPPVAEHSTELVVPKIQNLLRQLDMQSLGLFSQNRHPGLYIRWLKFGCEAPFEAGYQPLLQICYLAGRSIARQNDLLTAVEQGVEGMEKLLLGTLFSGKKVDIVDQ